MQKIKTSYSSKGIFLAFEGTQIVVESLPQNMLFDDCLFGIIDNDEKTVWQHQFKRGKLPFSPFGTDKMDVGRLKEGEYYLCVWCKHSANDNLYYSMIGQCNIRIQVTNDCVCFLLPKSYESNNKILETLNPLDSRLVSPSKTIQSNNTNIRNLAHQIKKDARSRDISLMEAVHEWVALNISYDMDALNDDLYKRKNNSSLSTYSKGKGVCQGYTNLTVAIFRALSIPSIGIRCCASNTISEKKKSMAYKESNHVFPTAWNGCRWVLMDPTWDSRNIFDNGDFSYTFGEKPASTPCFPFKFFDNTMEYLSATHEFTQVSIY
jgi:hypothetical protein